MALKIRRSVHENTEPEKIYFESDEEFEDWAVAPYATIVETETGKTWEGDYSDAYKEHHNSEHRPNLCHQCNLLTTMLFSLAALVEQHPSKLVLHSLAGALTFINQHDDTEADIMLAVACIARAKSHPFPLKKTEKFHFSSYYYYICGTILKNKHYRPRDVTGKSHNNYGKI